MLYLLTAAFALNHLDRQVLNIVLNDIGIEFQLSDLQLGSLSGFAFALIYAVLGFPIAKFAKPGKRKTILIAAISVWSAMTMIMGLTTNFVQIFLARVGVGIGEAGCVPASHSMIADAYPKEKRATSLAFFSAGTNIGIFLSFLVGGVIASKYGWRSAFLVAGLPGLFLGIVMLFTLHEPKNVTLPGEADEQSEKDNAPKYKDVIRTLLSEPSTRHTIIGAALVSMVGYGALTWLATFLVRIHNMELAQIGLYLAFVVGLLGALATWAGGWFADKIGKNNPDWRLKFVAVAILLAKPLAIIFYLSDDLVFALAFLIVPAALGAMFSGPSFSHIYSSIEPAKRAMATAILMFITNLIGLGLGPIFVGLLSDLLEPMYGIDSIRYALVAIQLVGIWGAAHFWMAGRHVKKQQGL